MSVLFKKIEKINQTKKNIKIEIAEIKNGFIKLFLKTRFFKIYKIASFALLTRNDI
ncbi:MAG: hypothetical protein Fur0024_2810 [Patescibacteria group bacterium]